MEMNGPGFPVTCRYAALAALTASFGYYTLLFYAREGFLYSLWLPPVVAAWAPNLVVVAIAMFLFRRPLAIRTRESHQ